MTDLVQAALDPRVDAMTALAETACRPPARRPARLAFVVGLVLLTAFSCARRRPAGSRPTIRSPSICQAILQPPSLAHPFGTDNFGRDILSRTIWAARIDLQIAIFTTAFPLVFGTIVGALVGYYGGWLDTMFGRARRPRRSPFPSS